MENDKNFVTKEELAAAFTNPASENNTPLETPAVASSETPTTTLAPEPPAMELSPIVSGPTKKSHKAAIISTVCAVAIILVIGIAAIVANSRPAKSSEPAVTISDLTTEQKIKLGAGTQAETPASISIIEDPENYSDEYQHYLELPDEEKADLEVIPRKEEISYDKIDEIKEDTDDAVLASLPEQFDLRDVIDITVGNQGSYGLCWSYASSTALETHLKLRGIDYNPSELQIDFLSSNLMYDDGRDLHSGGSFHFFTDIAASIGTISEAKFASLSINPDVSGNNTDYFRLALNDEPLYITKTVDFPSIYKTNSQVADKTKDELQEFRNLVKAHIMTNGALYTAISAPWGWGTPRYCATGSNGCYTNHAMSIIGWDDNYPKENFGKVNQDGQTTEDTPEHDGAYLVLNSWGEDWGEDWEGGAGGGAYWVSYDEYAIEAQLSGIISTSLDQTQKVDSIASQIVKDLVNKKLAFYIIEENGEKYISDYALERVTYLDLSSRGLTDGDLKDIAETFTNLSSLEIADNNISDLSPLANLDNLSSIYLSHNNITDISALCTIDGIETFDLSYNHLTDISCLGDKFDDYTYLNISGNLGVTGLEKITTLDTLIANEIGLESLAPLSNLRNLASLSVQNNNIKNLAGLNIDNDWLFTLNLSGNKAFEDLTFDKPIYQLFISDANLTDISILNNVDAQIIIAENNDFNDLSAFSNTDISTLNLSGNQNLSNISALGIVEYLTLSNCGIKSLAELGGLDETRILILNDNQIASFDGAENLTNLAQLDVSGNQISSLENISQLSHLTSFEADNNLISDASELANLEKLYFISLNGNQLTSIPDFTAQPILYLAFKNNPIEHVAISDSIAWLNLDNCNIKSIDYSQANQLTSITLTGNPGWNEYGALISKSMREQQNLGRSYPYITISTDYDFSKEELSELDNIPGLLSSASWSIRLETYSANLKKSSSTIINLEDYPSERTIFMSALKNSASLDGATIDKAATQLILDNDTVNTLSVKQWTHINNNPHISASDLTFNLE